MTDTVPAEPLLDLVTEPITEELRCAPGLRERSEPADAPLPAERGREVALRAYRPVTLRTASPDDDDTGGLPEDLQAEVRESALTALMRWYAGEPFAITTPGGAELLRMMSVCVGEPVPETYVPMIAAQLRFDPSGGASLAGRKADGFLLPGDRRGDFRPGHGLPA